MGLGQVVIPNGGNQRQVQMLRRKSSVIQKLNRQLIATIVLARAIRTAEHAGFVDNEVADERANSHILPGRCNGKTKKQRE